MNVATAKAINRLFRIADHHQPATFATSPIAVNRIKNAVLLTIGVLKLVDQRDRPGAAQGVGQRPLATRGRFARQRGADLAQQFVKCQLMAGVQARVQLVARERGQLLPEITLRLFTQLLQQRRNLRREFRRGDDLRVLQSALQDALQRVGSMQLSNRVVVGKGCQAVDELRQFGPCPAQFAALAEQLVPVGKQPQAGRPSRRQVLRYVSGRRDRNAHPWPQAQRQSTLQLVQRQVRCSRPLQFHQHVFRITLLQAPPQIRDHFVQQRFASHHVAEGERHPAGKRIIGQHAPAQPVQRVDRRHIQLGQRQAQACQVATAARCSVRPARTQPCRVRCRRGSRRFVRRSLQQRPLQLAAQSLAQFLRGGLGERGHHDLARGQLALQQQPQVQHRDGPGLAGAGAGLDQTAATVGQIQRAPIGRGGGDGSIGCNQVASPADSVLKLMHACNCRAKSCSATSSGVPSAKLTSPASSWL